MGVLKTRLGVYETGQGALGAGPCVLEAGLGVLEAGLGGLERLLVTNACFLMVLGGSRTLLGRFKRLQSAKQ